MIRHLLVFILTAGIGALLALAVRSAWHQPYAAPTTEPGGHDQPAPPAKAPGEPAADPHADHASKPAGKPVNDICAICGMKADPKLTATYREQLIAFGCKACPEEFSADPERYGPHFLKNQEAP